MNCSATRKFALFVLFLLSLACFADAQDKSVNADENIDVNIAEERITETNFERSTIVQTSERETNLRVRVGAAVSAQTINLTLRNVRATGRFRASLEKITRLLERGRIQD